MAELRWVVVAEEHRERVTRKWAVFVEEGVRGVVEGQNVVVVRVAADMYDVAAAVTTTGLKGQKGCTEAL